MVFATSPALVVIRHEGRFRITKYILHEDYDAWDDNTIIAQGRLSTVTKTFEKAVAEAKLSGDISEKEMTTEPTTIEHDANEVTSQGNPQATETVAVETAAPVAEATPAPAATAAPQQINIETRIEQYVKLRDLIKEQDDAHKKKMEPYRNALEQLNSVLLNHLNNVGVDSAKTGAGTVYKTVKRSASLEDADAFMRHVIGGEHWELLERKANVTAVQAFVDENGVLPPGVKWTSTQVVGVRRS